MSTSREETDARLERLRVAWESGGEVPNPMLVLPPGPLEGDDIEELLLFDARMRKRRELPFGLDHYLLVDERIAQCEGACEQILLHELASLPPEPRRTRRDELLERHPDRRDTIELAYEMQLLLDIPRPPSQLGKYELRECIGQGSFGTVWRAWDRELARFVALKLIPLPPGQDAEAAVEALRQEARSAARIDAPGVVRVHDSTFFRKERIFAIDTQLVATPDPRPEEPDALLVGRTLEEEVRSHERPWKWSVRIMIGVCDGVAAAHARGVVHRDLKPANVILARDDQPLVSDFGLAASPHHLKALRREGAPLGGSTILLDRGVIGTPLYMAPEQARGEPATPLSDVYALGAIFRFLLRRSPPLDPEAALETVLERVAKGELLPLPSTAPSALRAMAEKASHHQPEQRYPSAEALRRDLARWLEHRPSSVSSRGLVPRSGLFVRRNPVLVAASIVVVVFLAVIVKQREDANAELTRSLEGVLDVAVSLTDQIDQMERAGLGPKTHFQLVKRLHEDPSIRRILEQRSDHPDILEFLALAERGLGNAEFRQKNLDAALLHRKECLRHLRELRALRPEDPDLEARVSIALVVVGDTLREQGHEAEGVALYREAELIDEELVRRHPENASYLSNLSWSHERLGAAARRRGDLPEARRRADLRHQLALRILAQKPDSPPRIRGVATSHLIRASHYRREENLDAADEEARQALKLSERLIDLQPDDRSALLTRVQALELQLGFLRSRGRQSIELADRILELQREMIVRWPGHVALERRHAHITKLRTQDLMLIDHPEVEADIQKTLRMLRDRHAKAPDHQPRLALTEFLLELALFRVRRGERALVREAVKECIALALPFAKKGQSRELMVLEEIRRRDSLAPHIGNEGRKEFDLFAARLDGHDLETRFRIIRHLEGRDRPELRLAHVQRALHELRPESPLARKYRALRGSLRERIGKRAGEAPAGVLDRVNGGAAVPPERVRIGSKNGGSER